MTAVFKPLSNDLYAIPKAQILFKPAGSDSFVLLGDTDAVSVEPQVEETERYSNEGGVRQLAKTVVTQVDAVLSMTLMQLSDANRALSLLGELEDETQTAAVGEVMQFTDIVIDNIYQLGHVNVDNVVVTDGTGLINYVLNEHYRLDAQAGFVQPIAKPPGSDADIEVTYDGLVIVAADGMKKFGLASKTENRGSVIIRATNEVGPKTLLELWDVQLRPNGAREYISEADFSGLEITGRVFRDENQILGYELGRERNLI